MDEIGLLPLASRWLHVLAGITALGGAIFMRYVLLPAAESALNADEHTRLRDALSRRWKMVLHSCILIFLLTGFYNFLAVTAPKHSGQGMYHMLFGVKFLCALALFFLAIAVSSKGEKLAKFRKERKKWLGVIVALGVVIVMISGAMKFYPVSPLLMAVPETVAVSK